MTERVICGTCAFWQAFDPTVGVCRRHPPRPLPASESVAHWPETFAVEGCGDGRVADDPAIIRCRDCLFWQQSNAGPWLDPADMGDRPRDWWRHAGHCTRHAPRPSSRPGTRLPWPASHVTDGCGEGVERPPPAAPGAD